MSDWIRLLIWGLFLVGFLIFVNSNLSTLRAAGAIFFLIVVVELLQTKPK